MECIWCHGIIAIAFDVFKDRRVDESGVPRDKLPDPHRFRRPIGDFERQIQSPRWEIELGFLDFHIHLLLGFRQRE